jgi:hypothetical protein
MQDLHGAYPLLYCNSKPVSLFMGTAAGAIQYVNRERGFQKELGCITSLLLITLRFVA